MKKASDVDFVTLHDIFWKVMMRIEELNLNSIFRKRVIKTKIMLNFAGSRQTFPVFRKSSVLCGMVFFVPVQLRIKGWWEVKI